MANEKRLIDANAIPYEEHYVPNGDTQWQYKKELCVLKPTIDAMPTVDAVEVVHGHWEYGKWENGHWVKGNERCRCSVCHRDFAVDHLNIWHGCPQCLAKMDGERREGDGM